MKRKTFFTIAVLLLAFVVLALFMTHKTGEQAAILSKYLEKTLSNRDKAKLMMIKSATAQYVVEKGYSAASLDDLVGEGYISSKDIVDHKGKRFDYKPEGPTYDPGKGMAIVSKRCGECGKGVSSSSKVGDRCPHCGVTWGAERVTQKY